MMIEQPLWADDFYYHSMLQRQLNTPICLDESIHNRRDTLAAIEMESCRIINIKAGRVGGLGEAVAVHNAAMERGIPVWCGGMLETGIGRSHNIALSSLENFTLPGDVSASKRYYKEDIIEPRSKCHPRARSPFPPPRAAASKSAKTWSSASPSARKKSALWPSLKGREQGTEIRAQRSSPGGHHLARSAKAGEAESKELLSASRRKIPPCSTLEIRVPSRLRGACFTAKIRADEHG